VLLPFFSFMSFLIAVPTRVKFFNWIGTMWKGQLTFESPMLFSIGFLLTFLFGGLSGVLLASPPLDFHVTDTYFVLAHLHYVLFGTIVFSTFAGVYFWFPKMTGRMMGVEATGRGAGRGRLRGRGLPGRRVPCCGHVRHWTGRWCRSHEVRLAGVGLVHRAPAGMARSRSRWRLWRSRRAVRESRPSATREVVGSR
jgi:Cytochrome C and Quinol oxidase polypeptide I